MRTKLTLTMDEKLVRQAKKYAQTRGKSVSEVVSDYFSQLNKSVQRRGKSATPLTDSLAGILKVKADESVEARTPITRRLLGCLPPHVSKRDYHRYLEEKYR